MKFKQYNHGVKTEDCVAFLSIRNTLMSKFNVISDVDVLYGNEANLISIETNLPPNVTLIKVRLAQPMRTQDSQPIVDFINKIPGCEVVASSVLSIYFSCENNYL